MLAPYPQALQRLFCRSAKGMRLGLHTTQALLAASGHPDRAFDHVLVAGTNGKGSTSWLLAQALSGLGDAAGLLTSPHLLCFRERIRVGDTWITEAEVVRLEDRLRAAEAAAGVQASFFEATTLIACMHFAEANVPTAVVEVGLGGRLDSTNALSSARRRAAIVTPIDLDHQAFLGPDVLSIAGEKAAIMRTGRPVVLAPQHRPVAAFVRGYAQALGAPVTPVSRQAPIDDIGRPQLPGYLDMNRRVADAACALLAPQSKTAGRAAIDQAVRTFAWPGRYHKITARRPRGPSYLIDGSHNPAGMAACLGSIVHDPSLAGRHLHALVAVMPHKDAQALTRLVQPHVRTLHRCSLALAPNAGLPTAAEALTALDASLGPQDLLLVLGSLYLAGEALAHLCGWPADPPVLG